VTLPLPDVTLVAVDTICHDLAALAIRECLDQAQFGAVQIHTDDPAPFARLGIDAVFIAAAPFGSLNEVMRYLWYDVPRYVETSHALTVQWDSGIVNPAQWSERFLGCDYVGAPWGWHGDEYEVGNGGFSLRSRRLMHYIAERRQEFPLGHPEDDMLCRRYRPALERAGFRWASTDLALRFSFERTGFSGLERHFGYHGIFNWPRVFSVASLQQRIQLMLGNQYLNQPKHLAELLHAMKGQLAGGGRGELQPVRRPA
jgi:Protein of unknown function (DUF5672)